MSDGSSPPLTPADAPTGNSGPLSLRDPNPDELGRITRWPGNSRLSPEITAAKKSVFIRVCREKGIADDLIRAAWDHAVREWVRTGVDPYESLTDELLADWQGVRNPDAIIRHRLGLKVPA